MAEGSIINLGDISKPAAILVERVCDAVGGIAKPWQMKRVARAEVAVEQIRALGAIELTEIQERGLARLIEDAEQKQRNIESITAKAIPHLRSDADPAAIDRDWLASMFDRAQLYSSEEAQELWGRILGEEANKPGTFSRRSLEVINSLDASDARAFEKLCSAMWDWGKPMLVIVDPNKSGVPGLTFDDILTLESIGLISTGLGYSLSGIQAKKGLVRYHGVSVYIEFPHTENNQVPTGAVLFTKLGAQLAGIVSAEPILQVFEAAMKMWIDEGCWVAINIDSPGLPWVKDQAASVCR
ncbi:DUF2806 domain-containing protein [Ciceribacter azotifigens]|uniref:DUF2806 domain-containing protein n=1 Tax=Ciceribacter azotifigens TaxID=2069303 RepID=UPI003A868F91